MPLWNDSLLLSRAFLSGSSLHLFDLAKISDDEFRRHKPTVGDIDTQVDGEMKKEIEDFLKTFPVNKKVGNLVYIGYKPSGDQFITLWTITTLGINIQIDLELVSFLNGVPTPWSMFSHSSAWDDMKEGIKGVFSKYLMRAIQAKSAKNVIVRSKTGKEKIINKSELAFSLKGLRVRMEPILINRTTRKEK